MRSQSHVRRAWTSRQAHRRGSLSRDRAEHLSEVEVARPEVYNVRFAAEKELKEKLERLGEVLGFDGPLARSLPEILETAVDLALEKKDPKKKLERRRKREAARTKTRPAEEKASKSVSEGSEIQSAEESTPCAEPSPSRYIRSEVRERVFERADYRCEHVGPDGVRCTARARLEIDHIRPYAKKGDHSEANLRVLCRGHNLLAARREFGSEFMSRRIEEGRARASAVVCSG